MKYNNKQPQSNALLFVVVLMHCATGSGSRARRTSGPAGEDLAHHFPVSGDVLD
jgi:hypothetical protein